jgi:hypothetical protein
MSPCLRLLVTHPVCNDASTEHLLLEAVYHATLGSDQRTSEPLNPGGSAGYAERRESNPIVGVWPRWQPN